MSLFKIVIIFSKILMITKRSNHLETINILNFLALKLIKLMEI